ncbi:MAG TPA: hypothetical protein VJ476_03745 [Rhizomicrobium sp.]|nr:hypothetical protein [Rhizomicrobium sp.]
MREELILLLAELSQSPFQLPESTASSIGDIQPLFDFFCIDHKFQSEAVDYVGLTFKSNEEAEATAKVAQGLERLMHSNGYWTSHKFYAADSALSALGVVAKAAYDLIVSK